MKKYNNKKAREGAALFTVLVIIMTISVLLATLISSGLQRMFMAQRLADRLKATAYAEAGADEAYAILSTNFSARSNASEFVATSYDDGSYDATVIPVSNNMALIICTGVCADATAVVMVDVLNYGGSTAPWATPTWDTNTLDIAMLGGGDFNLNGSGDISGDGVIHVNGPADLNGKDLGASLESPVSIDVGKGELDGDATAPTVTVDSPKGDVTGTTSEQAVPNIAIPDIDLTPYYNEAADNGQVLNGDQSWAGDVLVPPGGIIWVNGNVSISSDTKITGTIIATGEIHISGNKDSVFESVNDYPVFISRDSDIRNQCSGTIDGFIYAPNGDYIQTANGDVTGMIVVGGDIQKGGNSSVMIYEECWPAPPGGDSGPGTSADVIGISAWQQ